MAAKSPLPTPRAGTSIPTPSSTTKRTTSALPTSTRNSLMPPGVPTALARLSSKSASSPTTSFPVQVTDTALRKLHWTSKAGSGSESESSTPLPLITRRRDRKLSTTSSNASSQSTREVPVTPTLPRLGQKSASHYPAATSNRSSQGAAPALRRPCPNSTASSSSERSTPDPKTTRRRDSKLSTPSSRTSSLSTSEVPKTPSAPISELKHSKASPPQSPSPFISVHMIEPCLINSLTHKLKDCGHIVITQDAVPCASNCAREFKEKTERFANHSVTPEPFVCPTCLGQLLEPYRKSREEATQTRLEAAKAKMGKGLLLEAWIERQAKYDQAVLSNDLEWQRKEFEKLGRQCWAIPSID